MRYILGLDCGGTGTKALLTDSNGTIISEGSGGPANYTVNGASGVVRAVKEAARDCLNQACLDGTILSERLVLSLGVSGAGRRTELEDIKEILQQEGFKSVVADHDARIALLGALGGVDGVVVIAGTGSIAYGQHDNLRCRVGGWGYILGDEGSAFWIAVSALQEALRMFDGRARPDQILLNAIYAYFQISDLPQLIPLLYQAPLNRGLIAGFSKEVTALADGGQGFCHEILTKAGCQLGQLALAALAQLELLQAEGRVGACGGVFNAGERIITAMQQEIRASAPKQRVVLPEFEPVVGAVLLGANFLELDRQSFAAQLKQNA